MKKISNNEEIPEINTNIYIKELLSNYDENQILNERLRRRLKNFLNLKEEVLNLKNNLLDENYEINNFKIEILPSIGTIIQKIEKK